MLALKSNWFYIPVLKLNKEYDTMIGRFKRVYVSVLFNLP